MVKRWTILFLLTSGCAYLSRGGREPQSTFTDPMQGKAFTCQGDRMNFELWFDNSAFAHVKYRAQASIGAAFPTGGPYGKRYVSVLLRPGLFAPCPSPGLGVLIYESVTQSFRIACGRRQELLLNEREPKLEKIMDSGVCR